MTDDLISRADAIDALENAKERYFDRAVVIARMQDILRDIPCAQPKQGEWIPCSERLPSDGQFLIIQYYDTVGKNHVSVVGAYYNEQQGFVDTGYGDVWFGNGNDDVLAWMPLPKPYGEREGE